MTWLKRSLILSATVTAGLFSATVMAEPFVFTAIPDQDESKLRTRFEKVSAYLSKSLGVETKYIPVKSYAAAVTAFRNNQVQLAWFGGLSGVRARALVPGSVAIAQGAEDVAFVTYFIANASMGLKEQKDFPKAIKGATFTFGSKGSTSGRLMPEYHISENMGGSPQSIFDRVGFSGDHSRTIALVQSGSYKVGAVNFKVWQRELKEGKIDVSKVNIVWRTPPYPDYQWSIRGDADKAFGAGFTDKVRQSLLSMDDKDLLAAFPRSGFIPAKNADYKPIKDVAKSIGLID